MNNAKRYILSQPQEIAYAGVQLAGAGDLSRYLGGGAELPASERSVVLVVPDSSTGEQVYSDLQFFLGGRKTRPVRFFSWEVLPFDALSPTQEVSAERMTALGRLLADRPTVVVATIEALSQKIIRPELFRQTLSEIRVGMSLDRDALVSRLVGTGYERSSLVEERGQFAVRGAVVDLFPPGAELPLRLELFGNELLTIRLFDLESQRSRESLDSFTITAAREAVFPWFQASGESDPVGLDAGVRRLKDRALTLELPPREIEAIEDAVRTAALWPGLEHLAPIFDPDGASFWDYVPPEALVVFVDELAAISAADAYEELVRERSERVRAEARIFPEPGDAYESSERVLSRLRERATIYFDRLGVFSAGEENITPKPQLYSNHELLSALKFSRQEERPLRPLAAEIRNRTAEGYDVAIVASHRARRFVDILSTYEIESEEVDESFGEWLHGRHDLGDRVAILPGVLSGGIRVPIDRIHVIAEQEILPEIVPRKQHRAATQVRRLLGAASQIKENDFIVHIDHGIGLYRGLRQVTVDGKIGDFLYLEYADGAKLFLPVENIGKIQKYVGSEGKQPALSKLGSKGWAKAKEKVRENVTELAGQLLNLYAEREVVNGMSFGPVDADDERFADTFPFRETRDQEKAISDVLADMELTKPMDRLVCGDVGYGKTEVALRAAFKAVNRGKQVAVLVPTTILADQHFSTFSERFREFPFTVACISRFYSGAANKETLEKLSAGGVDIIIGTHRLLQKDVYFKSLGLVVIDEEHRFGVADKEKLKRFRTEVDVLTLTATPIPRTLHLSLLTIRDLSVIETPPTDRQVIRTYLANYEASVVREAILREIGRGGQVFYIYNRVQTIGEVTADLREIVPEARIEFAHGQMKDDVLESVMHRFIEREFDVLVSTTIVESGLDIPNANTIIIRNADKLGLAELYQLRGRVGRSSRRAYAYLLISNIQKLNTDARRRLEVLQSLDDLGMGFRLALQDMEIRGAGNLLGKDQSGKIELVGFDMYSRILKEAVRELRARRDKTELPSPVIDPEMNIGFPAHIPEFYVPDVEERLLLYQRLVELRDETEAAEMADEIEDRFGRPPREVERLLELMTFRSVLRRAGIISASYRTGTLSLTFHREAQPEPEKVLRAAEKSLLRLTPSMSIQVVLDTEEEVTPGVLSEKTRDVLECIGKRL